MTYIFTIKRFRAFLSRNNYYFISQPLFINTKGLTFSYEPPIIDPSFDMNLYVTLPSTFISGIFPTSHKKCRLKNDGERKGKAPTERGHIGVSLWPPFGQGF